MITNQKGAVHLLIVLLLLVGIGVTVYLTQFTQVFKPKASEGGLSKITDQDYETKLNPFGDAWAWKKAKNTDIPVNPAGPREYITFNDPNNLLLEATAQYLAKSNSPYLYLDSYEPHSEGQDPKSITLFSRIKQLNPEIKILGYIVNHEPPPGSADIIQRADSGDTNFEAFLVHKKGLSPTKENRLSGRPDHPEWGYSPLMNITSQAYRAYIIPKYVETIRSAKMDGVMSDLLWYNELELLGVANDVPDDIRTAWPGAVVAFHQELKSAMGELLLFGNVNDDDPAFMRNDLLAPGRLDGVIFEDPFGERLNGGIGKINNLLDIVDSHGKKSILVVSGGHNGTSFSNTNAAQEKAVMRHFLAAYLQTYRSPNHSLLYYHPSSIGPQFRSEAFFREWDLRLGPPTDNSQQISEGVFLRKFQNGYVYWNNTFNDYTINDGQGLFNIDNSQDIRGQVVPAKSGAFFVTSSILAEYNTPPGTTNPPASPSPSPAAGVPGAFTLNPPETFCSGTNSHVRLSWTASPNGPQVGLNSGYFVYIDGVYQYNHLHNLEMTDPAPKNYGQTYTYKIEAVVIPNGRTFSNEQTVVAQNCAASPSPSPAQTCASLGGKCLDTLNKDTSGNTCIGGTHRGVLDCPAARPYCYTGSTCIAPSPSPIGKIGDLNGDGRVNIFDFNLFSGYFPTRDIRGDVDKNGQVNIFDFNALVTNFGK